MIIARLKGGLGNQMLQYATGRALSLKLGVNLKLDTTSLYSKIGGDTPRLYGLDVFNIKSEKANDEELIKFNKPIQKIIQKIFRKITGKNHLVYDPTILNSKDGSYIQVLWPCEKYFKDYRLQILNDFTLKNPLSTQAQNIKEKISQSQNSTSIHIRRGDYASNQTYQAWHGLTPISYYENAINYIIKKTNKNKPAETPETVSFFIFSDDINWVKNNLKITNEQAHEVIYVSDGIITDAEEITLMSLCQNNIITNSSFSWWGAWLNQNPNKTVITPKNWIANPKINTSDVISAEWVKM